MTKALVKTQIRLQQLVARGEAGQGTLEYIGMIIVAAMLVVMVVAAVKGAGVDVKIKNAVDDIVKGG